MPLRGRSRAEGCKGSVKVLLGTGNTGKLEEFLRILGTIQGVRWCNLRDVPFPEVEESGASLEENAKLKATKTLRWSKLPTLAEDSGLEVTALGGAPGVRSARYAGEGRDHNANITRLLRALETVEDRTARFRAVAVLALPDGRTFQAEGMLHGTISHTPRGHGGFGYDPVFVPAGDTRTLAELPSEAKDRISHRRRALEQLIPVITELAQQPFCT